VSNPRTAGASSVREQKLARVIDREVAPIWHDRFARMLLRELPNDPELFALDVHSGPGHTTAELLQRLDESSRIVALGRDPWLMQVAKTRVKPEWKRRVYFKAGDIDDVTGMNDATYDLTIANLVLGEQVVEWQPALAELTRVTKPGGQVLVTLPLSGTWQEVEDLFEEMLRDEGMRKEVATLQQLRRRRPKPSQLVVGAREIGLSEADFIVEHERFELLFRSGREFLFAPVIEHGPLRLWKAILGRAEKPQALFWRFKEAIDTYYAGRVLSVTVVAGLVRLRMPGGVNGGASGRAADDFSATYWSRYPSLSRTWGIGKAAAADASDEDFDLDIDLDETEAASDGMQPPDSISTSVGSGESGSEYSGGFGRDFDDVEISGVTELPAIDDTPLGDEEDPFAGLLDELDVEAAARAEVAAEDAEAEAVVQPTKHSQSGRITTLGALGDAPEPVVAPAPKPAAAKPIGRIEPIPKPAAAVGPVPKPAPKVESAVGPVPKPAPKVESTVSPVPKPAGTVGPALKPVPKVESVVGPAPKLAPKVESVVGPAPTVGAAPKPAAKPGDSVVGPAPKRSESGITAIPPTAPRRSESGITPIPPAPPRRSESGITPIPPAPQRRSESGVTPIPAKPGESGVSPLPGKLPPRTPSSASPLPGKLPPRPAGSGSVAGRLPSRSDKPGASAIAPPRTPGDSGTGSLLSRLPKRTPSEGNKPTGPQPQVTKPGEDDPFASMLEDDVEEIEEIDDIDEVPGSSLLHGELDDDEDLADIFGSVGPDASSSSSSGSRPLPPKKK
jgi:ubiquinone/menaquinone biosynthesis C-methylase UbiE